MYHKLAMVLIAVMILINVSLMCCQTNKHMESVIVEMVTLCNKPENFDGEVVIVSSNVGSTTHGAFLQDQSCKNTIRIVYALNHDEDYVEEFERDSMMLWDSDAHYKMHVIIEGVFHANADYRGQKVQQIEVLKIHQLIFQ